MHKQQPWQKKGDTTFDVTMGSYDDAEICELVGSFLLSQLQNINIGLYRDDGLAISNATPTDTEIQKTPRRKYAASLITMGYGSPSKPTNRPLTP